MRLVHTSDLHLNDDDTRWRALETVLATAEEKAEYLVISGDLFHKDAQSTNKREDLRNLLNEYDVRVFAIRRNHDSKGYPDDVFLGDNVTFMQEEPFSVVEEDEVRFIGMPYQDVDSQEVLQYIVDMQDELDDEKPNVLQVDEPFR